ncbi:hypothetical protein AV530_008539 [Patagioenas fasciata monilis]|uniref:Uncharacterized protein n=1 Tax=Patagioenas fasciata monilis TaxID=372326 RepID=A0A1V4KE75_PATFA|nr:hypothetical protein AV530_008539 [Patagioenas fasciata monilis]
MVQTTVGQVIPLQPMDTTTPEQTPTLQLEDPPYRTRWMPKGGCDPWRAHAGAGSWQDLQPCGKRSPGWNRFAGRTCDRMGDPHWSSLFLKDCTPWNGPMLEQLVKNYSSWEGPMLEKFVQDCLLWEGPQAGAGEECEESFL